jgi:hypothetical protein
MPDGKILTNKKGNPPGADSRFPGQPGLIMIWGCLFFNSAGFNYDLGVSFF